MSKQSVLTESCDGVMTVTINRPERLNALDRATCRLLVEALTVAKHDDAVRAVVLTGAGRGFCTGADLAGGNEQPPMTREVRKSYISEFTQLAMLLDQVDKPVIAAVNGTVAGAGLAFAAACDRRIVAESARFAAIFVRRGLVPDCGLSYYLPRLVGLSAATHLVMTGEMIDARTAERIGLADEVVPDDQLAERARAYAAGIAAGASVAVELARRCIRRSFERDLESALAHESWAQSIVQQTEDVREGINSFLEKRSPRFQGG